jgi:hypothetical protein
MILACGEDKVAALNIFEIATGRAIPASEVAIGVISNRVARANGPIDDVWRAFRDVTDTKEGGFGVIPVKNIKNLFSNSWCWTVIKGEVDALAGSGFFPSKKGKEALDEPVCSGSFKKA